MTNVPLVVSSVKNRGNVAKCCDQSIKARNFTTVKNDMIHEAKSRTKTSDGPIESATARKIKKLSG